MNKVGNCNTDVNKGNEVLIKVKDVGQMWQEVSMDEWSTPAWTGKQNASEQKVGMGMGCPRLAWRCCLCVMNIWESQNSAGGCDWWRMWEATRKASIGMLAAKKDQGKHVLFVYCVWLGDKGCGKYFFLQREVNLCLELLSDVIIGCMLMILVYFSWEYKLICLFYYCGGDFVCFKFLLSTHTEKQCFQRQCFLVWPFLKAGKWSYMISVSTFVMGWGWLGRLFPFPLAFFTMHSHWCACTILKIHVLSVIFFLIHRT